MTGGSASDTAADTQSGGAGVDKFVYGAAAALFSGTGIIDSLNGGDGNDQIVISTNGGAATTIANTVLYGRVTSVEEFAVLATDQDVSITLPDDSGFNKIDFSADTTAGGTNVINVSAEDTAGFTLLAGTAGMAITGSAVADNITGGAGNDTLTAGAGNDVIATGNGSNTVVAGDGDDSITGGTGADVITSGGGDDVIDISSGGNDTIKFLASGGNDTITGLAASDKLDLFGAGNVFGDNSPAGVAFASHDGTATADDFALIKLSQDAALADTDAAVALFEATNNSDAKMVLANTRSALLFVGDDSGTDYNAQLFHIVSSGGITATQIGTLVGINAAGLAFGDIE